jgi:hypothetical protein
VGVERRLLVKEVLTEVVGRICVTEDGRKWRAVVNTGSYNYRKFVN